MRWVSPLVCSQKHFYALEATLSHKFTQIYSVTFWNSLLGCIQISIHFFLYFKCLQLLSV